MAPRRYLVIANQTLAEAELGDAIRTGCTATRGCR
jgi:hypothetical protein